MNRPTSIEPPVNRFLVTDPSDMAALDAHPTIVTLDPASEMNRRGNKQKAQHWAKLQERPDAELFVFVGRWSKQKGIDLVADAMGTL